MSKRPPVDPAIIAMNAEALAIEFAEKATDSLSKSGLNVSEISRSADLIAHVIRAGVGLLQQEPGVQNMQDPNAPFVAFDLNHCYDVLDLLNYGMIYASEKAMSLKISGEPKSVILQGLAQDAFQQAKQLVSATVGQEATPELQFSKEQLQDWMGQMVAGAFHHYLAEYEKIHGPIEPEEAPTQEAGSRFQSLLQEEVSHVTHAPMQEGTEHHATHSLFSASSEEETSSRHAAPYASVTPEASWHALEEPSSSDTAIKLGALGLFLSTQSAEAQQEWLSQLSQDMATQVLYYMNVENVASELPLQAVIEQLHNLKSTLHHLAHDPEAQSKRIKLQLCETLANPTFRPLLEQLTQGERSEIQRLFKSAPLIHKHDDVYESLPQWRQPLENALLQYYQTLLAKL
jgi:hypothetical protein